MAFSSSPGAGRPVRSTPLRLAIGNIHRPGALTPSVVLSLGLGLALLVTLALIGHQSQARTVGQSARPGAEFLLCRHPVERDRRVSTAWSPRLPPDGKIIKVPMLRGRITGLNGQEVNAENVPSEARWVLRGDRGITLRPKSARELAAGCGRVVGARLRRRAAGVVLRRGGGRNRARGRRHDHRLGAWPPDYGADCQSARCRMGIAVDQLRHGVFAKTHSPARRIHGWRR